MICLKAMYIELGVLILFASCICRQRVHGPYRNLTCQLCYITYHHLPCVLSPLEGWSWIFPFLGGCCFEASAICAESTISLASLKACSKVFPKRYTKAQMWLPSNVYDKYIIQASHLSAPGPMSQRSSLPTRVPVQVSTLERWVICDGW